MTTVLARVTLDGLSEVVDAGREQQIVALGELGIDGGGGVFVGVRDIELAQRNGAAGRRAAMPGDSLAVGLERGNANAPVPFAHRLRGKVFRGRWESCRPWCREAAATRLAGGCGMPTKTMFQLAPVQLPHSLLREIHCCCGPAPTLPSMSESDIHPPLAQPPF